jgi:hypothetical protein
VLDNTYGEHTHTHDMQHLLVMFTSYRRTLLLHLSRVRPLKHRKAPRRLSSAPRTTREGPTTTSGQRPPAAQRIRLGLERGGEAWLNLEQVASIIQLHNKGQTGRSIVTTLLQGTEREDWDTVWTHVREAEGAAAEMTGGPTTRVRDRPTALPA